MFSVFIAVSFVTFSLDFRELHINAGIVAAIYKPEKETTVYKCRPWKQRTHKNENRSVVLFH